jgi:hypothetical protein
MLWSLRLTLPDPRSVRVYLTATVPGGRENIRLRVSAVFSFLTVVIASLAERGALGADSPLAIDELKTGYALKQAGKCEDAIPHFLASYRADPRPKALLNLADCEQQLHLLLAASDHARQGLSLARQQQDRVLTDVAQGQLDAIDHKLPRLIVRMAPEAPAGTSAVRDGTVLGADALEVPVPLDPGAHRVVAMAPGRAQREFEVILVEGQHAEIEVEPGAPIETGAAAEAAMALSGHDDAGPSTRRLLTYGVLGVGGAGIIVGVAVGIAAGSKHSAIDRECNDSSTCPSSAQGDIDSFHSLRTWSTIGYVSGVAGLATGVVLWLTAPKSDTPASALWLGPASAGVAGRF